MVDVSSHSCPDCGEVLDSISQYVAHKKLHRGQQVGRVVRTSKQCPRCRQIVPAQSWIAHRRFCFDQQSERRPHTSSSAWKALRQQILDRDQHRCTAIVDGVRCQETEGLQVAHLAGDWRDDDPAGLASMCEPCHKRFDAARSTEN